MNALTIQPKYNANLPAFMQSPALFEASQAAIAGISGGAPPSISVRASKFRLVSGGEEQVVNQIHLDVIVLDGNPNVSKTYYAEAYNPADGDTKPPTCWSDNGIAPSTEASSPQSASCATCQWGAWGSKVTQTGSRTKACGDSKKLAIVLAADTAVIVNGAAGIAKAYEQVFLLRVPTMSMQNWKAAGKRAIDNGIPTIGVVWRMTFDPQTDYPAILFEGVKLIDDGNVFSHIMTLKDSAAAKTATGANAQPRQGGVALAPPAALQPAPISTDFSAAQQHVAPPAAPPAYVAPPAPQPDAAPAPRRRGRPPQQETQPAPVFAAVVQPQPVFTPPPAPPAAFAPTPAVAPQAAPPNGMFSANPVQPAQQPPAAQSVIVTPTATNAEMDAMLNAALNGG